LTLRDYVDTVRRRKWLIVLVALAVPIVAYVLASRKPAVYETSAQVLINRQNLAFQLQGVNDPTTSTSNFLFTQAALARVPVVARRTVAAAGVKRDASELLGASSVTTSDTNDLLTFSVRDHEPAIATRLATEYARQFVVYTNALQDRDLTSALRSLQERISTLKAAGGVGSPQYTGLVKTAQQLRTLEALETSRAVVVREPAGAGKIAPTPRRAGLVGVVFGMVLGLVIAFVVEGLDTRVRSEEKLRSALGLSLLGRVGRPASKRGDHSLVMFDAPLSAEAEALRIVATNLELVALDAEASMIMLTSAAPREGKTTTTANLGVAFARQGRRVILVDLDLQAPMLHRLFNLENHLGATDVAVGRTTPEQALVPIEIPEHTAGALTGAMLRHRPTVVAGELALEPVRDHAGDGGSSGSLHLLSAGSLPPDNARFISSAAITQMLQSLRGRSDMILIDAPPLLVSGAAVALTAQVDGLVVVCKLKLLRARVLAELKRVLDASPTQKLGLVVTNITNPTPYYHAGRYVSAESPPLLRRER
jgi:non-specific protein-tyrosine kinase